ncbi:MAG: phage portal protein [Pseudomonadota bacterium]
MWPFSRKHTKITSAKELDEYLRGALGENVRALEVSPETAMRCTTVWACVRVLSTVLAHLPLHVYDGNKEIVTDSRITRLLARQPNQWMSKTDFWRLCMTQLMLWGCTAWRKIRTGSGEIGQLMPVEPGSITVDKDAETGDPIFRVTRKTGVKVDIDRNDLFFVCAATLDGYEPLSPVRHNKNAIALAMMTEEFGLDSFARGAKFSGILKHPSHLTDEAAQRLRSQFEDAYHGKKNWHKTIVTEDGMEYQKISQTAEEAQFNDTRELQRSEIASIWGVPPHKIGDLRRATFGNIEHQALEFVIDALTPYLTLIEERIQLDLMSARSIANGQYVKFKVDGLLRGDSKARFDAYSKGINWGIMSPNEARALEDLPAREGGDDFLTPVNVIVNGVAPNEDETPSVPA